MLIKLDRKPDELILKSGGKLFIDPSFEPEKNAAVTGKVIALPKKLHYSRDRSDLMPWKTEIELKKEDKVIFYFMSSVNAFKYNKWFKCTNGNLYVFVRYEHIYVAKRGNKTIPINGYCIIEPLKNEEYDKIESELNRARLLAPEFIKNKLSIKYGRVKYLSTPNKEYWTMKGKTADTDDGCNIEIGDKIVMRRSADIPLEYEHHASLKGKKKFFRVQRRYINAIV